MSESSDEHDDPAEEATPHEQERGKPEQPKRPVRSPEAFYIPLETRRQMAAAIGASQQQLRRVVEQAVAATAAPRAALLQQISAARLPTEQIRAPLDAVALPMEQMRVQMDSALLPLEQMRAQIAALPPLYDTARLRAMVEAAVTRIDLSGLAAVIRRVQAALPPNWDRLTEYEQLGEIAREDGLPVIWLPRAEILDELLQATDREARVRVLLDRRVEILEDFRSVVGEVTVADLVDRVPLAEQAARAFETGAPAAAQALAVAVTESLLTKHVAQKRRYAQLASDVNVDLDDLSITEVRTAFTLLPVAKFYTTWFPEKGDSVPEALSRHATVHHALPDHLNESNALIAVMLLGSLLRDLEEVVPNSTV